MFKSRDDWSSIITLCGIAAAMGYFIALGLHFYGVI